MGAIYPHLTDDASEAQAGAVAQRVRAGREPPSASRGSSVLEPFGGCGWPLAKRDILFDGAGIEGGEGSPSV